MIRTFETKTLELHGLNLVITPDIVNTQQRKLASIGMAYATTHNDKAVRESCFFNLMISI